MDDIAAITLLNQGDLSGLDTLVLRYQVQAVHAAQLIVRDRGLAEDAAQTAFLRIAERVHQFDDTRAFKPWFMRIVVNEALKMVRKEKRIVPLPEDAEKDNVRILVDALADGEALPEDQVILLESKERVRKALDQLTPEQRAVVVMRYFLEMRESEMVMELVRPKSTIKWWLHSARKRLRSLLQGDPISDVERSNQ